MGSCFSGLQFASEALDSMKNTHEPLRITCVFGFLRVVREAQILAEKRVGLISGCELGIREVAILG